MVEQDAKVKDTEATASEPQEGKTAQAEPQPQEDTTVSSTDDQGGTLSSNGPATVPEEDAQPEATVTSDPGQTASQDDDQGGTITSGPADSNDETLTEVSEEFAETAAGRDTGADDDGQSEPVEEDLEPVSEALPVPDGNVPADEGPGSSNPDPAAEDGYQDGSTDERWIEDQEPAPPEVSIGVSAVETLPDETPAELADSRSIDEMVTRVPREIDDDQIENSDLVKKPDVENKPDPDSFPGLQDSTSAASGREVLDVFDVAEGDADGTEPTREASRMSRSDATAKDDGSSGEEQRVNSSLDSTTLKRTSDAEDSSGKDGAQPDAVREVQPVVAANMDLTNQDAPAAPDLQAEVRPGEEITMKSPGSDPFVDGPGQTGSFDPAADVAIEGSTSPMTGPKIGANVDLAGAGANFDSISQSDAPGPVSDSSGIQSGEITSSELHTLPDGGSVIVGTKSDGSKVETVMGADEDGMLIIETSADGKTERTTSQNSSGEVTVSVTTTNKDGSTVTETTKSDGTVKEEHSDGTVIVYNPDGTAKVVAEPKDDNPDDDEPADDEPKDDEPDDDEPEDDEPDDATGQSATGGEAGSEESASRPSDDYMVDPETLAAMHESEAAWQQAIRESSTINPGRVDVGTAEGRGDPPPGVDDPPEDEAPRSADDLPDDDPGAIGASGGNIDWGPDQVDQNETAGSDHRVTEELGTQSGYGSVEANPADAEDSLTLDPAAMQKQLEEIQQSASGVVQDDALRFFMPDADESSTTVQEEQSGAVPEVERDISLRSLSRFDLRHEYESALPVSAFEIDDDENQDPSDDDGM